MSQIIKHQIYTPLAIRNERLDYANRPTPCLEVETEQVLKYNPDLTVEQAKDQAQERLKKRKGAVIGELSQSVTVALNLYQDNEGNRKKLMPDQKDLIAHVSRLVCAWLFLPPEAVFAPMSRTALTPQMVNGLGRWMTEYQNGEYVQRFTFRDELAWVIHWAKTAYDWSVVAASQGDELLFADIIERHRKESVVGDGGQEVADHWDLHSFSDYVEMKTQGNPPPNFPEPPPEAEWLKSIGAIPNDAKISGFPEPQPQVAPGAVLPDETAKDMGNAVECDFFDF